MLAFSDVLTDVVQDLRVKELAFQGLSQAAVSPSPSRYNHPGFPSTMAIINSEQEPAPKPSPH